ncbi:MAG: diguanylate cyclase, partial [Anaeroplasmataceae bacterium]|nr:diguanylate cyclase [Anaeroplasmataceae bacterium]
MKLVEKTTPKNYAFSMEIMMMFGKEPRWVRVSGRSLFKGEPAVRTGIIGKIIDINAVQKTIKDLQHKATHDSLTLLYNAGTAKEKIKEALRVSNKDYVMVFIDLDYFKTINDTYGHNFGNQVLQHISAKLTTILRKSDIIARIGGDEFLVVFEEHPNQDATIKRIFSTLTEPFNDLQLSVSVGVASTKDCGKNYDDLFNGADKAAYCAKNDGKHCIRYYDDTLTINQEKMTSIDVSDALDTSPISLSNETEMKEFLKNLHSLYESARIYNIETSKVYVADVNGNMIETSMEEPYINAGRVCAYERALMTRGRASEIVYQKNNLFYSNSIYLECDSTPYILEIVMPLKDDIVLDSTYTKTDIIAKIDSYGERRYVDTTLNTFNRTFFEEQLGGPTGFYSMARIEVQAKEQELKNVIKIFRKHVRFTDVVIRIADNEFFLLLEKVKKEHFQALIEAIYKEISKKNKIYIGACNALG